MKEIIIAKNLEHLKLLIKEERKISGNECDLNHINVSKITNMDSLFMYSEFNGDISKWDTSNVTSMESVFSSSPFNGDISNWNTSKVENMMCLFSYSDFSGDISQWNVSNVKNMDGLFCWSKFNQDISSWNVSKVEDMTGMFKGCKFNQDLTNWKPLSLNKKREIFDDFIGEVPYWVAAENTPAAVRSYLLDKELEINLTHKDKNNKRLKL